MKLLDSIDVLSHEETGDWKGEVFIQTMDF